MNCSVAWVQRLGRDLETRVVTQTPIGGHMSKAQNKCIPIHVICMLVCSQTHLTVTVLCFVECVLVSFLLPVWLITLSSRPIVACHF